MIESNEQLEEMQAQLGNTIVTETIQQIIPSHGWMVVFGEGYIKLPVICFALINNKVEPMVFKDKNIICAKNVNPEYRLVFG